MRKLFGTIFLLALFTIGYSFFFFKNPRNSQSTIPVQVKSSTQDISWNSSTNTAGETKNGNIKGIKISRMPTSAQATPPHFGNAASLGNPANCVRQNEPDTVEALYNGASS